MPHPLQFGFVKEHGAIPAIYTLKEAIHYYLERNIELERKRTCTYAGTLINSDGKTVDRSDKSSKKLKQKLHSLYTVGVNPRGMSALTYNVDMEKSYSYNCTLMDVKLGVSYPTVKLKCWK
ncbi:Hypothetical predicted protein [Mytilus galloprovincialis]|uniref:Uncharacterized protein n=1 Tax=Mytilus galloprovincialis TaxID=29158 RepID=A0A8B6FAU2_MYTGA|nr:Hypothetical predicted protein [Mytilus galloprovincialis]